MEMTRELVSIICERNVFQAKSLNGAVENMRPEERAGMEAMIGSYLKQGDTIEHLAECYLCFVQDIMEEQFFFVKNGRYRYSRSDEVDEFFYQNPAYMEYYMKGLAVSTYLMRPHLECRRWFADKISKLSRGGYIFRRGHWPRRVFCPSNTAYGF